MRIGGRPRGTCAAVAACCGVIVAVVAAQQPAPPHRVYLEAAPTARGFATALENLSIARRAALGIEVVTGPTSPNAPRDQTSLPHAPGGARYDLTPLAIGPALAKLSDVKVASLVSAYGWQRDGDVYDVAPVRFADKAGVALNRRVAAFDLTVKSVPEALQDVHRIFDPKFVLRALAHPGHEPERLRPLIERPMEIRRSGATVRDILNEIVRQHGAMSWMVEYADAGGSYRGMRLSFLGFDGWVVSTLAKVH